MKLECREFQKMIQDYLDDQLDDRETRAFLNHVSSCTECRYELETSYMIICTLKWMDTDREFSANFHELLDEHLKKSERKLRIHSVLTVILWVMIVLMGAAIVFIIFSLFFRELLPEIGRDLLDLIENTYGGMAA